MFLSHGIDEESLIRSYDLIRSPLLKVGQHDLVKVEIDSVDVQ